MSRSPAPQITVHQSSDHDLTLTFPGGSGLESIVSRLPFAAERGDGRWQVGLCFETVSVLVGLMSQGTVATDVTTFLSEPDTYPSCADGMVLPYSSEKYPYIVLRAWSTEGSILDRIPGGFERKTTNGLVYPTSSAGAIARLVYEGTLTDPQGLFPRADAVVTYDASSGEVQAFGDERVEQSIDRFFPRKDVVAAARNHGVDVLFSDAFSEEFYRGAVAGYATEGLQPEGITLDLFPYQRTSVAQLLERDGMGVFLAPGLGKTLVAVAAGLEMLRRGLVERVFITPPAAVSDQWQEEILRFTATSPENVVRVHGTAQQRAAAFHEARDAQWVIVHHDLLVREFDQITDLASGSAIVFDEAHKGANVTTKRSKAMADLAKVANRRIALTGTPVPNDVPEWFSIMGRLVVPGLFGSGREFCQRYQYPNRFGKGYEGVRRLPELALRSRGHFIRHTKEEVAQHLPPLQVKHMPVKPTPEYRKALTTIHLSAADELSEHYDHVEDSEALGNMTAYGMLRAICSSPRLIYDSDSAGAKALAKSGVLPEVDGPKVDKVRQIAKAMQDRDERIVMFTYSRNLVKLIAERFVEDGIRYVTYHGETSDADRIKAVKAFQAATGSCPTVFLATDAAAEGLNLGHQCCTLLNIDLPWTAGKLDQRYNRIHRVDGTHSHYLAVNMTIEGTVEDSILRKVESKAGIADVLFGERSAVEITGRGKGTDGQRAIRDAMRDWKRSEVHM